MKKTILLSAITLISLSTFAQKKAARDAKDSDSRITYGVKAGVTFPTVSISGYNNVDAKSITSFYVGGIVNIPVYSVLSVQPGLTLIGKGTKLVRNNLSAGYEGFLQYTPWYLEVPINIVANFEVGPGKLFVGAGPYLSFGIGGNKKGVYTQDGSPVGGNAYNYDESIKFGTNSSTDSSKDIKSLDFGFNFLLGYQLPNGLSINGGYGLGLTNIDANSGVPNSTESVKSSVISVGLGFAF